MILVASREAAPSACAAIAAMGPSGPALVGSVMLGRPGQTKLDGLPIPMLGAARDLPGLHEKMRFSVALICADRNDRVEATSARQTLTSLGVRVLEWPSIQDILRGAPHASPMSESDLAANLLGRPLRLQSERSALDLIHGRRVLITGAGGSIGSELARRCATCEPGFLALMDRSENALFEIDRELRERHPHSEQRSILHDVVDPASTKRLVSQARPDVVFHAAAHKHVPMMQDHPGAALSNNLFGTRSIAQASLEAGASRFVMISTDKAVHPRSVMGASKWLAEQFVRSLASQGETSFRVVRFGNVLGSACSVLPIWSAQLDRGGPITVTDPNMTRYFMTIPEAAALVIQSAALAEAPNLAPVYVLDMGEPIRIGTLAERFVRGRALEPRWLVGASAEDPGAHEIGIRVTGIRPGEKLHEELAHDPGSLGATDAPGVLSWHGEAPEALWVQEMIEALDRAQRLDDAGIVIDTITRFVPELSTQNPNKLEIVDAA